MLGLLCLFSPAVATAEPLSMVSPTILAGHGDHRPVRCDRCLPRCWNGNEEKKGNGLRRRSLCFTRHAQVTASASPRSSNQVMKKDSSRSKIYQEVLEAAREKFTREISFQSKDKDISLAK
ncbi:hypothetical protein CRG98_022339, partial [Punica granatum]